VLGELGLGAAEIAQLEGAGGPPRRRLAHSVRRTADAVQSGLIYGAPPRTLYAEDHRCSTVRPDIRGAAPHTLDSTARGQAPPAIATGPPATRSSGKCTPG
jgi:hypothetical protein